MRLEDKVVIVTGASKGIGRAIALEAAKEGANVVINYLTDLEGALTLEQEIKKYGKKTLVIKADVKEEIEVKKLVDEVKDEFKRIDVLVNNAGIAIDTLFEDKTKENFMKTLDVNLIGPFLMSKYVGKIMLEQRQGKIINIASTNGIDTNYPMSIDYDASKAGLISLTKNLAKEYAPYINVNAVAPGWVNTPMNKEMDDSFKEEEIKKIFLNRFAEPSEIAKVVTFLASDDASYINSEVIRVDGGF